MISNGNNGRGYGGSSDEYPISRRKGKNVLEQQAVMLGWDIPADKKRAIVERQVKIATESEDDRHATIAAKCLTSMNAQNVAIAISPSIQEETNEVQPVPVEQLLAMRRATAPGG